MPPASPHLQGSTPFGSGRPGGGSQLQENIDDDEWLMPGVAGPNVGGDYVDLGQ